MFCGCFGGARDLPSPPPTWPLAVQPLGEEVNGSAKELVCASAASMGGMRVVTGDTAKMPLAVRPADVKLEKMQHDDPSSMYTVSGEPVTCKRSRQQSAEPSASAGMFNTSSGLFAGLQGSPAISAASTRPGNEYWLGVLGAAEGAVSSKSLPRYSAATARTTVPALSLGPGKTEVSDLVYVGQGATGLVYRGTVACASLVCDAGCETTASGPVTIAVKFMICNTPQQLWQRAKEALLSKLVSHPNLVRTLTLEVSLVTPNTYRDWAEQQGSTSDAVLFPPAGACPDAAFLAGRTAAAAASRSTTATAMRAAGAKPSVTHAAVPHDSLPAELVPNSNMSQCHGDTEQGPIFAWTSSDTGSAAAAAAALMSYNSTATSAANPRTAQLSPQASIEPQPLPHPASVQAMPVAAHPQIERLRYPGAQLHPTVTRRRHVQERVLTPFMAAGLGHASIRAPVVSGTSTGTCDSPYQTEPHGTWPRDSSVDSPLEDPCGGCSVDCGGSNMAGVLAREFKRSVGVDRGSGGGSMHTGHGGAHALGDGSMPTNGGCDTSHGGCDSTSSSSGPQFRRLASASMRMCELTAAKGHTAAADEGSQRGICVQACSSMVQRHDEQRQQHKHPQLQKDAPPQQAVSASRGDSLSPVQASAVRAAPGPHATGATCAAPQRVGFITPARSPEVPSTYPSPPPPSPAARQAGGPGTGGPKPVDMRCIASFPDPVIQPHSWAGPLSGSMHSTAGVHGPASFGRVLAGPSTASLLSPLLVGSPCPSMSRDGCNRYLWPTGGRASATGGGAAGAVSGAVGTCPASGPVPFQDILYHLDAMPGRMLAKVIMEYCDSGTLLQRINAGDFNTHPDRGPLAVLAALRALLGCVQEVVEGMAHLHSLNIIHGDLKPGNVLLTTDSGSPLGYVCKVSDFGLATALEATEQAITHENWGTVVYMAPESCAGRCRKASDVYSFGVLLWQMCTGQRPFAGLQAGQVLLGVKNGTLQLQWPPWVNKSLIKVGQACMRFDPKERPGFRGIRSALAKVAARLDQKVAAVEASGLHEAVMAAAAMTCSGAAGHLTLTTSVGVAEAEEERPSSCGGVGGEGAGGNGAAHGVEGLAVGSPLGTVEEVPV